VKNSTHIQLYEKAVKIYLANQFMIVKKIIENPHNKQVVLYNISVQKNLNQVAYFLSAG